MGVHEEAVVRQSKSLTDVGTVIWFLRQIGVSGLSRVKEPSNTVSLQKEVMKPIVVDEGRVSLPHTGDTLVDVGELHESAVLVLSHIRRPHSPDVVTGLTSLLCPQST